jgi:hypothetical protein
MRVASCISQAHSGILTPAPQLAHSCTHSQRQAQQLGAVVSRACDVPQRLTRTLAHLHRPRPRQQCPHSALHLAGQHLHLYSRGAATAEVRELRHPVPLPLPALVCC